MVQQSALGLAAIVEGVYDGETVALSTRPTELAKPVGMAEYPLPEGKPEFGVFVVLGE